MTTDNSRDNDECIDRSLNDRNENEDKIQSIFRAAPVGIGVVVDRVITEVNDTLCLMTGYSKNELIGKSSRILYPSDMEFDYVGEEKYPQIRQKGTGNVETRWKKKSGEIIDIILSSSAIDINNLRKGVTFTALDISERKRFEEQIRLRDLQLNHIAVNAPITFYQFFIKNSGESGFNYISESSEQIFGLKNDPENFFEKFSEHVAPEHREKFFESIKHSINNKTHWEFSGIFIKDSGKSIWFRVTANPVMLDDEIIYNGIGMDITGRVKSLALHERTVRFDSFAHLAGAIAHDFNNVLGGIFGYIQMARSYSGSDKRISSCLDNAMEMFDRSKKLTGELLSFSRGGELIKKSGSIPQTLIEITRFLMNGSGYSCEFSFPEDLWKCDFDNEQICSAFENIIKNAIQAMPAGGNLQISARNAEITENKIAYIKPGRYLKIAIKDSGSGIPGEMIPRIFDPFFTTKEKCKGMGLATSYSIITRHHGYIDVDSSPGKGTDFYVYLPVSETEDIKSEKPKPVHSEIPVNNKRKGSIIIMDDEVFIRETIGSMLEIMGYRVYKAAEGSEVLRILGEETEKGNNFSAAILDLTIPNGMDGKETIYNIRKMGIAIPVIASSGYSDDPVMSDPHGYGFTDSLRKPYRMEDLAMLLNYYISGKPE